MSLTTVIILNAALDLAILSAVTYACHLPRRLRAHHQPARAADERFVHSREPESERQAA